MAERESPRVDSPSQPWAAALSPGIDHVGGRFAAIDHVGGRFAATVTRCELGGRWVGALFWVPTADLTAFRAVPTPKYQIVQGASH